MFYFITKLTSNKIIGGYHFVTVKIEGLNWVLVIREDTSISLSLEVIYHLIDLVKDICGDISEECLKINFSVVYEIIDEVIV